jgi:hypothetical protein
MVNVLYIHGMGGGGDSRIPSILRDAFADENIDIIVRTYDFDPEVAQAQIESWLEEIRPSLVIGESLGTIHAIKIAGIPHLLISPSLNAPLYLGYWSWLALVPGVTWLLDRIYKPKDGDRQKLHFKFLTLKKYLRHRREALANSIAAGSQDYFHAFIGTRDHYRKSGIVSIRTWKKYFGETYTLYEGTHFTEEEFIWSLVVPKIRECVQDMP